MSHKHDQSAMFDTLYHLIACCLKPYWFEIFQSIKRESQGNMPRSREAEKQKSRKAEEAKSAEAGTMEYRAKTRLSMHST